MNFPHLRCISAHANQATSPACMHALQLACPEEAVSVPQGRLCAAPASTSRQGLLQGPLVTFIALPIHFRAVLIHQGGARAPREARHGWEAKHRVHMPLQPCLCIWVGRIPGSKAAAQSTLHVFQLLQRTIARHLGRDTGSRHYREESICFGAHCELDAWELPRELVLNADRVR